MTTTTRDAQALTYLATRLRDETHGCGKWDQNGTYAVISELVGMNLAETIRRVVAHALDPEARTPGAIKRPFVPKAIEDPKGPRFPAKPGDECRQHRGEYADACRLCAVEQYTHPADPEIDGECTQGRALLAEIRARREGAEG